MFYIFRGGKPVLHGLEKDGAYKIMEEKLLKGKIDELDSQNVR